MRSRGGQTPGVAQAGKEIASKCHLCHLIAMASSWRNGGTLSTERGKGCQVLKAMPVGTARHVPSSATSRALPTISGVSAHVNLHFRKLIVSLVLDIIHVIPLYHKCGIGSFLIDWGLEQADKEGSACYVESSPAARPLCIQKGFKHIGEMQIELGRYKDGYEQYRHMILLRPPYKIDRSEQSSQHDPFTDDRNGSISPIAEEVEVPYTAEAKMLHFRSKSSLRSVARLTDARGSKKSLPLSQTSDQYRDIPAPVPKGPSSLRFLNAG